MTPDSQTRARAHARTTTHPLHPLPSNMHTATRLNRHRSAWTPKPLASGRPSSSARTHARTHAVVGLPQHSDRACITTYNRHLSHDLAHRIRPVRRSHCRAIGRLRAPSHLGTVPIRLRAPSQPTDAEQRSCRTVRAGSRGADRADWAEAPASAPSTNSHSPSSACTCMRHGSRVPSLALMCLALPCLA